MKFIGGPPSENKNGLIVTIMNPEYRYGNYNVPLALYQVSKEDRNEFFFSFSKWWCCSVKYIGTPPYELNFTRVWFADIQTTQDITAAGFSKLELKRIITTLPHNYLAACQVTYDFDNIAKTCNIERTYNSLRYSNVDRSPYIYG